jgi:Membrane bound beta barrel domain (DUF5777)
LKVGFAVLGALLIAGGVSAQQPDSAEPERPRAPEGPRIINLPSADVPAKGVLGVFFTHRFAQALGDSDYQSLFSFDSGADIGIGLSYSPLDVLELSLDRTSAQDDYELAAKIRLVPFAPGRPFALALRVGGNARTEEDIEDRTGVFAQGIASVAIGRRVRVTAIPTYVSNTPFFRDVFNVPIAVSFSLSRTVNVQGEYYPKNRDFTELPRTDTAPARKTHHGWVASIEKTVLRHRFAWTVGNVRATVVDQYTGSDFAGGIPKGDIYLGFNLVRQWKLD